MPKRNPVWFRKQDRWFYCTIPGRKVKLSQDHEEAIKIRHQLKASSGISQQNNHPC